MVSITPEGKVKRAVNKLLDHPRIYAFMPVQNGMGAAGLDYHCAVLTDLGTLAFFVETKAPGKKPTPRQDMLIARLRGIDAKVFVIDGEAGLNELRLWLGDALNVEGL